MNDQKACDCGCGCTGKLPTPVPSYNPPGLSAIRYRAGTHGRFLASMLRRLAAQPALDGLRTREPDDPAIALLDCWALVGDVLTFYSERYAQEGYLPTATEQESLVLLGRLVGYRPRPALGAGGFLAYALDPGSSAVIPTGSQVKSVPAQGQQPQTFETSEDLVADAAWNSLGVRLTAPPLLTVDSAESSDRFTLVGSGLNLRPGDRILAVFGTSGAPTMRVVAKSTPDFPAGRTVVDLVVPSPADPIAEANLALAIARRAAPPGAQNSPLLQALDLASNELHAASVGYDGVATASRLVAEGLAFSAVRPAPSLTDWLDGAVADTVRKLRVALTTIAAQQRRSLPEVEYLRRLGTELTCPGSSSSELGPSPECERATALVATVSVLPALRRPPSQPPSAGRYLDPALGDLFGPASDAVPRLLAAADPRLATGIHQAWTTQQIAAPRSVSGLQVLRVKTRPLPPPPTSSAGADPNAGKQILLEGAQDGVLPGGWLVVERAGSPTRIVAAVVSVAQLRIPAIPVQGAPPVTTPATLVTLDRVWYTSTTPPTNAQFAEFTVWAAGEDVVLADEPLVDDVAGDRIELDGVYSGLRPGRRLVVTGERTDVPGVTGVRGSELTMLAAVQQAVNPQTGGDTVHATLQLPTPLAYMYKRDTVTIHGNVVPATQGETRSEALGSGDAGLASQVFPLRQVSATAPLTYLPDSSPAGAAPELTVRVDGVRWHPSDDLSALGPLDHGYTLVEREGAAAATFGDGVHGSRLPTGVENVRGTYRVGTGASGNLPPDRITQLVSRPLGVGSVTNPLPSTGGADADGPQDTRAGIPLRAKALDRLVSARDYADLARARPGIGRAVAAHLYDGRHEVVHVTVAGVDDVPLDVTDPLLTGLGEAFAAAGDPSLPVRVDVRQLVLIALSAGIKVAPDYSYDLVEPAVRAAVLGVLGFAARDLAQPAYLSRVLTAMQAVPGVDYVDVDVFGRIPADADPLALLGLLQALQGVTDAVDAQPATRVRTTYRVDHDPMGNPDNLTSIALRHGVSVAQLVARNPGLKSVQLTVPLSQSDPGQLLVIEEGIRPAQLALMSPDLPETLILRRIP